MVYLYCVTDPLSDAPAGTGLDGSPLRVVAGGELTAVVSDRGDAPLHATEESLWAHERVVEDLMSERAVLPMRFGSVLGDDDAVGQMLVGRVEELSAALRRVSGAVELGVRAAWDPEAIANDRDLVAGARGQGTAYLLGRSESRRRAHELAERLDRSLAGLSRTRVQRLLTSPSLPVSAAYLVDRTGVDAYRGRIATLDAHVDHAEIVWTGPWPPYSFTAAEES